MGRDAVHDRINKIEATAFSQPATNFSKAHHSLNHSGNTILWSSQT
jgi:hypothetical protein